MSDNNETARQEVAPLVPPRPLQLIVRRVMGGYIVSWDFTKDAVCTDLFEVKKLLDRVFGERD